MDDMEVTLSDGTVQMGRAIVDQKTALGILVPADSIRSVSVEETIRVLEDQWISWAGSPKRIH